MEELDTKKWKKKQAKEVLKKLNINFLYRIKMLKKILKFDNVKVNKKEFHVSNQTIVLNLNVNQILISDKFEHSDKGFKYYIGYKDNDIVRLLCMILPQMSGFIKYFDDSILVKYNEIWDKIKNN